MAHHVRKCNNMTLKSLVFRSCAGNLCDVQQVFVCVIMILSDISDI